MAVLLKPVMLKTSAANRMAVLSLTRGVVPERDKTNGRVVEAGYKAEKGICPRRCCRWDSLRPVAGLTACASRGKRKAGEQERNEKETEPQRRPAN